MDQAFEADFLQRGGAYRRDRYLQLVGFVPAPSVSGQALTLRRCYSLHSPFCLEQSSLGLRGEGCPKLGGTHPFQWPRPTLGRTFASQALSRSGLFCRTLATKGRKIYGGEMGFAVIFSSSLSRPQPQAGGHLLSSRPSTERFRGRLLSPRRVLPARPLPALPGPCPRPRRCARPCAPSGGCEGCAPGASRWGSPLVSWVLVRFFHISLFAPLLLSLL